MSRLLGIVLWTSLVSFGGLSTVAVDAQDKGKQIKAKDLAGKYHAVCTNPNGKMGEGTVEIEWLQGNKVKFTSIYASKDVGEGALNGDVLSVKYRGKLKTERTGTAEYRVLADGSLEGWWHYEGQKKMPEKLTRKKGKK